MRTASFALGAGRGVGVASALAVAAVLFPGAGFGTHRRRGLVDARRDGQDHHRRDPLRRHRLCRQDFRVEDSTRAATPTAYTALFDQLNAHGGIGRPQDRARLRRREPHRDGGGGILVHAARRGRPRLRRLRAPERDLLPGARHTHHQRDGQRHGAGQGCGQPHARTTGRRIRPPPDRGAGQARRLQGQEGRCHGRLHDRRGRDEDRGVCAGEEPRARRSDRRQLRACDRPGCIVPTDRGDVATLPERRREPRRGRGPGICRVARRAADEPEHLQPAVGGNELQRPRRLHHREELERLVRRERTDNDATTRPRPSDGRTRRSKSASTPSGRPTRATPSPALSDNQLRTRRTRPTSRP